MAYTATIGLEIHAELKTKTKLFCISKNDPDETRPNVNVCPICMGHPGTLPVLNEAALHHMVRIGTAVGGEIADYTEFDRKNYFYPDIPKGYQISQYAHPLVKGGELAGVKLTRIHLEEDTARSTHADNHSLVDFNRAGIPLMELVTEPVIHTAKEAGDFARELQLLLRYLGASDANMEKGEMRVEANVSVSNGEEMGTKVEVKNINSFRAMERAIAYEVERQSACLADGKKVVQETRGWDENTQQTFSQRLKESSHDYRYFPDPDVPKFKLSDTRSLSAAVIKEGMPELPHERRERYTAVYGLKTDDVERYVRSPSLGGYFETVAEGLRGNTALIQKAANYILSDLAGLYQTQPIGIPASSVVEVMRMIDEKILSSRGAKDLLGLLAQSTGADPRKLAEEKELTQKSNEKELRRILEEVIGNNKSVVEDYRKGKEASLMFLVGQTMKATKGAANPQMVRVLLEEMLHN